MRTITVNAIVELNLPDVLDVYEYSVDIFGEKRRGVKISMMLELNDVKIIIPPVVPVGGIGRLSPNANEGGQVLTIKKLFLRGLHGDMLPVQDVVIGDIFFLTVQESTDKPLMVEAQEQSK